MTIKTTLTIFAFACVYLSSASAAHAQLRSYNPVHAQYEKAGSLGEGRAEISSSYTNNRVLGDHPPALSGENTFGQNLGLRVGYGFSDKVDLKLRYEHVSIPGVKSADPRFNVKNRRNYFISLIPKINLQAEKFSLLIPLSFYDYESNQPASNSSFHRSYVSVAPLLIRTFSLKTDKVDLSPSFTTELVFEKDDYKSLLISVFSGFNLAVGFSSNLKQWALRPELGYNLHLFDEKGVWNFGLALQVMLSHNKK